MPKSPEQYQPSEEEIKKAEDMMTPEQKELSKEREETIEYGRKEALKKKEDDYVNLYLKGLESAEGLILPESVVGDLYLSSLESAEKNVLRLKYPHLKSKIR